MNFTLNSKKSYIHQLKKKSDINNYRELNKRVKAEVKKNNDNLSEQTSEMEDNFKKNNTHTLFK